MKEQLKKLERTKNFYKHVALYLAKALETGGLDHYRLWTEAVNSFHEKYGEEEL